MIYLLKFDEYQLVRMIKGAEHALAECDERMTRDALHNIISDLRDEVERIGGPAAHELAPYGDEDEAA